MRILFVAMQHDYGDPARGDSYEHASFREPLVRMGHEVIDLDPMAMLLRHGRRRMNAMLLDVVERERPDLMFTVLFGDQIDQRTIRAITEQTDTTTLNWFIDDDWRWETFSRHWAPCFDAVVTTSGDAVAKYEALGLPGVIKSQFACNPFLHRPSPGPAEHDVTFAGQPHGDRPAYVGALVRAGIPVEAWGSGWANGRLDDPGLVRLYSRSRINLNFSTASGQSGGTSQRLRRMLHAAAARSRAVRTAVSAVRGRRARTPLTVAACASVHRHGAPRPGQIKGRTFEVPACGGLLLTEDVDGLDEYYMPDREVAVFSDETGLVRSARQLLGDEGSRAAIAAAGHRRTLAEHTYVHRFADVFHRLSLPGRDVDGTLGTARRAADTGLVAP